MNLVNGSLGYVYPIDVPAGPRGVEPNLALHDNSQARSASWVGVGWGLELGSIERIGATGGTPETVRAVELVCDGLRRWPYEGREIAQALATVCEYGQLVAQRPNTRHEPRLAHAFAEQCFGEALRVEIGHEDNNYTQSYANKKMLRQAVREDFYTFLTGDWRSRIKDIRHIFQIAFNPRRALVFERFETVFASQIVPTQVVLRDEASGKARLYNPARAIALGLP